MIKSAYHTKQGDEILWKFTKDYVLPEKIKTLPKSKQHKQPVVADANIFAMSAANRK